MTKISYDIKYVDRASKGKRFIFVITDGSKNYLVTKPLHRGTLHELGEAVTDNVFYKKGPSRYLIFDEDQAFYQVSYNTFTKD